MIARDAENRPIGTGRLSPDRLIGRMAVLSEWRGRGVGEALLKALLDQARALGYRAVELHAQVHAISFYTKYGFEAYGDEFDECAYPASHDAARSGRAGTPRRAPLPPRPEARALVADDRDQAVAAIADLLADARTRSRSTRAISIRRCSTCRRFSMRSGASRCGPRARACASSCRSRASALADGHRLLALAQRLPSLIEVRTPEDEHDRQYASAFLINDRRGYLFRMLASRNEGEGSTYAPGRHAQLREYFDQVWERVGTQRGTAQARDLVRHPGAGRDPAFRELAMRRGWIPACAGMTGIGAKKRARTSQQPHVIKPKATWRRLGLRGRAFVPGIAAAVH